MDILTYLRGRREDFKRGGFIRPDGRPGMVTLSPEAMYEQALPELALSSLGEPDTTVERRQTFIKIGIFVVVALLFVFLAWRGRSQREDEAEGAVVGTPTTAIVTNENPTTETALVPTPPLPEITGVDDSLQTIGSLGGALTIGRPSALEIHYSRTEETIALAIDPSKPTPKGEMRFNEAIMLSDNPVAVWLFGTVLNYAIGIPDSLVRNLEVGDRLILSTDTGASLRFVVAETQPGANYEAGRLLSQNRLGLTLFALPAVAEEDVAFAFANYDVSSEEEQGQPLYALGEQIALSPGGDLQLSSVVFSHTPDGSIRIVVDGSLGNLPKGQSLLFSLAGNNEQTTAVPLIPDANGQWQTQLTLPATIGGQELLAELRLLPSGSLALVRVGEAPRLIEQVQSEISGAWWDTEKKQAVLMLALHNAGAGEVYLGSDFIQFLSEGGDVYDLSGQVIPRLPTLISPGETMGMTVSFLPPALFVQIQIGADLWAVSGFPDG